MDSLERILGERANVIAESKPIIFNLVSAADRDALSKLFTENKVQHVVDDYEEQLKELFQVNNPVIVYTPNFGDEFKKYKISLQSKIPFWQSGRWVFFPWLSTLVHLLEDKDFQCVRTARNRYLISDDEQKAFYNATVGIGGLSIGNSVALSIVLQGGARRIRIADHDKLALTNLNRIRAGVEFLGLPKVYMAARQIYSLNPYAEVEVFSNGLTPENIGKFFDGLDIVIDELDNIAVKLLIREQARKHKIAVVTGADNGDNAIIDVERHDIDPNTKFFHGVLGSVTYDELIKLDKFGIGRTITKMLGPENVEIRMQESLMEMGKTIVSWPQLGGAALLNGIAMAYCVRKIINKQPLIKEQAILSLDEKLDPTYNSPEGQTRRRKASENFKKILGL